MRRLQDDMLWSLLTLTSSVTFLSAAIASAFQAKAGFGGYISMGILGSVLGSCNFWTMKMLAATIVGVLKPCSEIYREWGLWALYFVASLWAVCTAFLGEWLASSFVQIVA